jgi:hypothetical protein
MNKTCKLLKTNRNRVFSQEEAYELLSMIDGAYEIIELYDCNNKASKDPVPYTTTWCKIWLDKAKSFGVRSY